MSKNLEHKIKKLQKLQVISPEASKVALERLNSRLENDAKEKKKLLNKKVKGKSITQIEEIFLKYIPISY